MRLKVSGVWSEEEDLDDWDQDARQSGEVLECGVYDGLGVPF